MQRGVDSDAYIEFYSLHVLRLCPESVPIEQNWWLPAAMDHKVVNQSTENTLWPGLMVLSASSSPSGWIAGKTSLMAALAGKASYGTVSGSVKVLRRSMARQTSC